MSWKENNIIVQLYLNYWPYHTGAFVYKDKQAKIWPKTTWFRIFTKTLLSTISIRPKRQGFSILTENLFFNNITFYNLFSFSYILSKIQKILSNIKLFHFFFQIFALSFEIFIILPTSFRLLAQFSTQAHGLTIS